MLKTYGHVTICSDLNMFDIGDTCKIEFSVMYEEKKKNGESDVNLFYCEAWDSAAEFLYNNAKRGSELYIEAINKNDRWIKDGEKRSKVVLRLTYFKII
jgi:single-stranded DNA-binding protein